MSQLPLGPAFAGPAGLRSMVSVAELLGRPSRPPDYEADSRALLALAQSMAEAPEGILQKLAETALALCRAHSAGLSLLEDADQRTQFHWRAIAGEWAPHLHGGTPRDFGPCGTVLDRNAPMVCSHPELDFPYFGSVTPLLEEGLLVPFYVGGEAIGTIWVVAHDPSRRFDAEDLRRVTNLGTFAAAAYQTLLSLNASRHLAAIVESSDDAIISKDLNGIITSWNQGAERIFGYSAEEIVGRSITIIIPPERHGEEATILERLRRGERIDHFETVRIRKDGTPVDVSLTISPIGNAEGRIIGASKIARDISERRQHEAKSRFSPARPSTGPRTCWRPCRRPCTSRRPTRRTASSTPSRAASRRWRTSIGCSCESRWTGAGPAEPGRGRSSPPTRTTTDGALIAGPTMVVQPERAQALAVVLHELATNAAKYGSLSVSGGHVEVDWSRGADGRLVLRWTETGGPPVEPPSRSGFGTRVMENMIRGQRGRGPLRLARRRPRLRDHAAGVSATATRLHGHAVATTAQARAPSAIEPSAATGRRWRRRSRSRSRASGARLAT